MEARASLKRQFNAKTFFGKYAMYVILVALIAIFGFIEPAFFTGRNFVNILTSESSRGLLALGVAFCIISRGIDLSLGSVMALSSVFSASLVQKLTYSTLIIPGLVNIPPIPAWVAVLVGPRGRHHVRPHQRYADRVYEDPPLHRHPGLHDRCARPRAAVYKRLPRAYAA